MTGVIQDITEVLVEGTEDLSRMAFDKPYQEVFEDFALIDAKVEKHDSRQDQSDKRDLLLLQSHVGSMNNPLNFLTPILIVSIIIIAILATVCICAMGFCWYVRYSKKQERRLGNQPPDPENNTNNGNISMNNVNEESIQFINNVYKDWKRSESMRSGSRHSRRDREEVMSSETQSSDLAGDHSVPLAGDLNFNEKGWKRERHDEGIDRNGMEWNGKNNKEGKLNWE